MITRIENATSKNLNKELSAITTRLKIADLKETFRFPKFFQLETVRLCNSKCSFCPSDKWDKSTPFMSDELFEKISLQFKNHVSWIEAVCLQRAGEPLLDKKISTRVARLKDIGINRVTMATNASLLNEKKTRDLISAGLDEIWISIDSVEKATYEKMRKGLKFEVVMKNIVSLFEIRDQINPELQIRVRGVSFFDLDEEEGRCELASWEKFWRKYKKDHDRIAMKKAHNWGNQLDIENNFGEGTTKYGNIYHPCILPYSTMHITAMGKIALCAMDYDAVRNMGDLNTTTIEDVWRGKKFEDFRTLHASGKRNEEPMCRGCKLFDLDFSLDKEKHKELQDLKELYEF